MTKGPTQPQISKDNIARQAAEWVVRLSADREEERSAARAGFEAWKREDAQHAQAAQHIEGFISRVCAVRDSADGNARVVRAVLNATGPHPKPHRTKAAVRTLALALMLGLPFWFALQSHSPSYLMSDLRTPTGRWASNTLQDGTRLTLSSASAVNLRFSEDRRTIELVQGEILVDVAHDADRPLWVETPHGDVRALGTRFVVGREDGATVLTMIESKALAKAASRSSDAASTEAMGTVVGAGQRARITADGVELLASIDPASVQNAWKQRQLVANDRPLAEVLDELNRHRPGTIRYNRAQLEGIHVFAVLPLDDTDRALLLLATSLPALRVRTLTDYLVVVDAPALR
jgi:transmembrane sensor